MSRAASLLLTAILLAGAGSASATDLVLVALADIHSAYDSMPRVLGAVQRVADEHSDGPTYVLVNGDVFEPGNVVAARAGGEIEWEFLERLDAIAPVILNLGNHEFDFAAPEAFMARAERAGLTVIGNIVDRETGGLVAPAVTTIEVDGRAIDVVGLATDALNTYAQSVRSGIVLGDPVAWADVLGPLTVLGDHVVVLSHAGVVPDRALASALPDDTLLLVGAHDHLVLAEELDSPSGADPLYLHTGSKAERLAVIELTFGDTVGLSRREVVLDESVPADPELAARIETARDAHLEPEDLAVVGRVDRDRGVREAAGWAVETLRRAVDADVALLNHTSFGAGLARGPLARHAFDEFLRFDNDVVVAEVDGATLARILALANQGPGTPLAERTGDFVYATPIEPDPDRTYRVATSSWVALPSNVERYLGTSDVAFEPVEGVSVKGILADALAD